LRIADYDKRDADAMTPDEMKARTKAFAIRVVRLVESLPKSRTASILGGQLLRAGTSVGANYRAACRAKSAADFISKMGTVEEECDESLYWMELLIEANLLDTHRSKSLYTEGDEILKIVVSSINTARKSGRQIRNPQSAIRNGSGSTQVARANKRTQVHTEPGDLH
jgi:four helix bundle protein